MDSLRPEQKYEVGEHVQIHGWVRSDTGIVVDIKWVYHLRLGEYVWGYKIKYDGGKPVLNLVYVPEGYLRKIEGETNN